MSTIILIETLEKPAKVRNIENNNFNEIKPINLHSAPVNCSREIPLQTTPKQNVDESYQNFHDITIKDNRSIEFNVNSLTKIGNILSTNHPTSDKELIIKARFDSIIAFELIKNNRKCFHINDGTVDKY